MDNNLTILSTDKNANATILSVSNDGQFCNSIVQMQFTSNGTSSIYYDTSHFSDFTVTIENQSSDDITANLGLSPNGVIFEEDSVNGKKTITPDKLGIFPGTILIHFTSVNINAATNAKIIVYLQAHLLS